MSAVGTRKVLNRRRSRPFAIQVEFILFAVSRPPLFESTYGLHGRDTESAQRQNHGSNADMGRRARANVSAVPAPENRRADITLPSKPLKHLLQLVSQRNERVERHVRMPLLAQPLQHLFEPNPLWIAGGHASIISGPAFRRRDNRLLKPAALFRHEHLGEAPDSPPESRDMWRVCGGHAASRELQATGNMVGTC